MNKEITEYFRKMDRSFYMEMNKDLADINRAFPIGYGQTISQPSLVLEMTIALDLHPEHKVLEIGTGSGFQTDLLAAFTREVYTVERILELHKKAQKKLAQRGFTNIFCKHGNGAQGWKEAAPFDRIMVTAAGSSVPKPLIDQLKEGGKMIIPVGKGTQELLLLHKNIQGEINTELLAYVQFVKLHDNE